jgi:curli biogenesis system outer membrane secretion channel CsgG
MKAIWRMTGAVLWAGMLGMAGGCAMVIPPVPPLPKDAVPPRVAVASFENRSSFDGQWNLGSGMADLLVSELVSSRNFVVLERGNLDTVVDEISRQRNRLFREEGRVEEGRLDNARYLIRGVITDFSQASGGSLWMGIRRLLIGSGGYTARVGMTLTIVDIESGRIVDSVQCSGKARAGNAYAQASYKGIQFGGRAFFQTPLGVATAAAIRQGLHGIVKKMPKQQWAPMIADVKGAKIVINGGLDRGLQVGQHYQARGSGTPVTDPLTGDVLDILPGIVIGTIQVSEVREGVAVADPVSGKGFDRGQFLAPVLPSVP